MTIDPKFYLKDNKAKGKTAIQLRVYIDQKMFRYGIGASIFPALWDENRQRPKKGTTKVIAPFKPENPHIKVELENVKTRIEKVIRELNSLLVSYDKTGVTLDFKLLKKDLDNQVKMLSEDLTPAPEIKKVSLNQFIDEFITQLENGKTYTTNSGQILKYQASTIKVYKEWRTQFTKYQKDTKKKLGFKDITLKEFYPAYKAYFVKKDYTTNSIGKQIKMLKSIMRMAFDEDLHHNLDFKKKEFRTLKTDVDEIYLKEEEVLALYELDLTAEPHMELIRDVFVVGCFTAMRFSDYSRIKPVHIKEENGYNYIDMKTQKTGERVIVPIRDEVYIILKKYEYNLPKTYEQKLNKRIKVLAERAGISEMIQVSSEVGGRKEMEDMPKYKLIKSHTARRTGATLMHKAGIPLQDIMLITGHKKESSLKKYLKLDKMENAANLVSNKFFSNKAS